MVNARILICLQVEDDPEVRKITTLCVDIGADG